MRKLICFLLCRIVFSGFSFGCAITNQNAQSTSESESAEIPKEEQKGSIYSLHALYEAGKLTQEDLLNIAYYSDSDFDSCALSDYICSFKLILVRKRCCCRRCYTLAG